MGGLDFQSLTYVRGYTLWLSALQRCVSQNWLYGAKLVKMAGFGCMSWKSKRTSRSFST